MDCILIVEGGSFRGAFAYGVVSQLQESGLFPLFTHFSGTSASATTLAGVLSDVPDEDIDEIWTKRLSEKKFFAGAKLWGRRSQDEGPILNLDYLIDEMLRYDYPIDCHRLKERNFYIPLTHVESGNVHYVKTTDEICRTRAASGTPRMHKILKAAMALPGPYNEKVTVGGVRYIDGGILEPIPRNIHGVPEKRVYILTQPEGVFDTLTKKFMRIVEKRTIRNLQKEGHFDEHIIEALHNAEGIYRANRQCIEELREKGSAYVIQPVKAVPSYSNDSASLREVVDYGKEIARSHLPALAAFLGLEQQPEWIPDRGGG